ncbi:hypothetical protein IAR55_001348 [Kwoniella newhampshirensis]|uniref:Major facilitator superfamily (MFS) profile domain-containing protein n=1 Tax=Kwoniella newhampshirensis TaxID=1651941 RepID=A0AAW0Z5X6_9TREE
MAGSLLFIVTLLTAKGFLLIGYDNGVMGGVINEKPFQTTFKHSSSSLLGTILAICEIGCCAGSIVTAFGFLNSAMPVLLREVLPKTSRGRFVCFQLSLLNLGIMTAYWTGYGFSYSSGSKAWRTPVPMQAIFIVPILLLVMIPESPRWLASHGRAQESFTDALVHAKHRLLSPNGSESRTTMRVWNTHRTAGPSEQGSRRR